MQVKNNVASKPVTVIRNEMQNRHVQLVDQKPADAYVPAKHPMNCIYESAAWQIVWQIYWMASFVGC
jgi:hypothetical protein